MNTNYDFVTGLDGFVIQSPPVITKRRGLRPDQVNGPFAPPPLRRGPFSGGVELFGLTLRREHPLPFGRGVALPLLDEALLMSFEVGDALSDLVAL